MFEFVIKIEDNSPVGNPIKASNFLESKKIKSLSIAQLSEMGYAPFALDNPPIAGLKQKVQDNGLIVDVDGFVKRSYELIDRPQDEIDVEELSSEMRKKRNLLLLNSDWSQLPDSPLSDSDKALWVTYRQDLRDVSSQENFPFEIIWPEKP